LKRAVITDTFGLHEVSSDGRTIWVNGPEGCLARFCPVSQEFMSPPDFSAFKHPNDNPTAEHWQRFVDKVRSAFDLAIDDKHRPLTIEAVS
jgi:hypothetical protein